MPQSSPLQMPPLPATMGTPAGSATLLIASVQRRGVVGRDVERVIFGAGGLRDSRNIVGFAT